MCVYIYMYIYIKYVCVYILAHQTLLYTRKRNRYKTKNEETSHCPQC